MNPRVSALPLKAAGFALFCLIGGQPLEAAEFIFRELMGNTLPPLKCQPEAAARERASSSYELNRYAKVFCETQGYGWYLETRKTSGRLVCTPCEDAKGKQQCHVEDIEVTCKRLKPGSAGLIPGQG